MKPCPTCHFLLPADAMDCQFCKAPLGIDADADVATPVFTGAPARTVDESAGGIRRSGQIDQRTGGPRPTGPGTAVAWDRSARGYTGPPTGREGASPTAAGSAGWPPEPALRRRSGGSGGLKAIVIVVVVLVLITVLGVAATTLLGRSTDTGFQNRPWTTYTAPDGSFTALAPGVPTTNTVPLPQSDGTTLTEVDYSFLTGPKAGIVVDVVPLRPDVVTLPELLPLALTELRSRGMTIDHQAPATFDGAPAMTFAGSWTHDGDLYELEGQVFVNGTTLFVVIGNELENRVGESLGHYERFVESFAPAG